MGKNRISDFEEILDAVLPEQDGIVTVLQAYFDESYGEDGLLCVAGYVFTKAGARQLTKSWGHMLKKWGIPFFRMSACAHGNYPFDKFGAPTRDKIAREAIATITKCAAFAVANTVNEVEFNKKVPEGPWIGNGRAYEFCVWNCLMGVSRYTERAGYKGKVAYFFEAGHARQTAANALMTALFSAPNLRADYRYAAHAFVGKTASNPVQAADVLAWQYFTDRKRELAGKPRRRDMEALFALEHLVRHIDVDKHAQMVRDTMDAIASRAAAESSQ